MDADVIISHNSSQEYNIMRSFDDSTREVICFSHIIDQVLSDISTEHRKQNTLANIAACFFKSSNTWSELKQVFGGFERKSNLRNKSFTASYSLTSNSGFLGQSVGLKKEYQPQNPSNLDGKLSVSTTLYAIHLGEKLSSEDVELITEVLNEQLSYYQANGYPSWGTTNAPAEAVEKVLRY
jgi:hypothetical protein